VLFYVLFVCKYALYYFHRVSTLLQLNISYHIIYHIISYHIISYHIIANEINGTIRRHFGKQIDKETKLRIHNITAKAAFKFGSEA